MHTQDANGERFEEPADDNGDDPRDTPGPKIYGEELDPHKCEPTFIVSPPKKCKTKEIEVPAFRGNFCYFVYPGSPWQRASVAGKLIEAQTFFAKYCMYFNFTEVKLKPKTAGKYEKWYKKWKQAVRKSILPNKHIRGMRKKIKNDKKNRNKSKDEIDQLLQEKITKKLRSSTIPRKLHKKLWDKLRKLHKAVAKKGCKKTLIVFIDEYICYNPKPTRVSACQLYFNQIGITAPDAASKNVLAHEMVHLLGKPTTKTAGKATWEHEMCDDSVMKVTRARWWEPYQFADLLSSAAYQEIIVNQNKSKNRLIEKIK